MERRFYWALGLVLAWTGMAAAADLDAQRTAFRTAILQAEYGNCRRHDPLTASHIQRRPTFPNWCDTELADGIGLVHAVQAEKAQGSVCSMVFSFGSFHALS